MTCQPDLVEAPDVEYTAVTYRITWQCCGRTECGPKRVAPRARLFPEEARRRHENLELAEALVAGPPPAGDEDFEALEEPPQWLDAGERTDTMEFAACPMWHSGCRWTTGWYTDSENEILSAQQAYRDHWREEH